MTTPTALELVRDGLLIGAAVLLVGAMRQIVVVVVPLLKIAALAVLATAAAVALVVASLLVR